MAKNDYKGPGSKYQEYRRLAELFREVTEDQGYYYGIALLYDMQYDNNDLKKMLEHLKGY